MPLDLTLLPLYRINGQEQGNLPGLLALMPPPNAARGRERDHLIVYLLLAGNASFSTSEYLQLAQDVGNAFYQFPGALTSAMRAAADNLNKTLLERNVESGAQGQFAVGWLTLAALRDSQCTLSLSGPVHAYWFGKNETRHIHEPAVSGKGLGSSQTPHIHYAQLNLSVGNRLLFVGRAPEEWSSALDDPTPSSLDATRRRLRTLTSADLNAVLMQTTEGRGILHLLDGMGEAKELKTEDKPAQPSPDPQPNPPRGDESASAHVVQPAAYQTESHTNPLVSLPRNTGARDFPSSIPRITTPSEPEPEEEAQEEVRDVETPSAPKPAPPPKVRRHERPEWTRQTAKVIALLIQGTRRALTALGGQLKIFIPRLLPTSESNDPLSISTAMMFFISLLVPLIVVTVASVVYLRYGRSLQYEAYLRQAQEMRAQAVALTDPIAQRKSWENVLLNVDIANSHRQTSETLALRQEAEINLDKLLGISRLQFSPAFSNNLGIDISRMAASEFDLFLLNAANGEVLRAQPTSNGRGFLLDTAFACKPGQYGNYTVGPLVDILALPPLNSINASLLGIDATGNLLYCSPGQVAQAIPLPTPDTNWGRVTGFALEGGNLYVLDAPARAVWVYTGKDGTFIDRPYFFFGGQTPEKQDVIDLAVSGDDLFMLHADGHLSTCFYSRIEAKPTQCQDPSVLKNPFAAYQDIDLFGAAHFTQILFAMPPDSSILLLDADSQGILRFSPRELELQNQFRPATHTEYPVQPGPVAAMTIALNHVVYIAVDGQVYFSTNMP
jgi:hypothetical protein